MKVFIKKSRSATKQAKIPPKNVAPAYPRLPQTDSVRNFTRLVLNQNTHDPLKQLKIGELSLRVVALAQMLMECKFYPYQVEIAVRIVESLLVHDGDTLTALLARQIGKTQTLGAIVAAIALIFPLLAKQFPESWHLNITDDSGAYRGFAFGIRIGIYAPRLDQSAIMFERVKHALGTDTAKKILRESNIKLEVCNGNSVRLSNGSRVLCESASEQSKIEGETHNLLVIEEAQEVSDLKLKKSLSPMTAATGGTTVLIGTATTQKCAFYTIIKLNEKSDLVYGKRNHFFYPYLIGIKYNSFYARHIDQEKIKLGENSDEFQMSYACVWVFERGMFITQEQLFNVNVVQKNGVFALRHFEGLPKPFSNRYSIVIGADWGASHDSTVLTAMAVDWTNPLESGEASGANGTFYYEYYEKHVLDWLEFIGDNYEEQFPVVLDYIKGFRGIKKVICDSNGCGKPIYDRLVANLADFDIEVEDFNYQAKLKSDAFKSFYADICGKRITFPAADPVRRTIEYKKFVYQMLDARKTYKNQLMQVDHPDEKGAHDDYVQSCALAAWGANHPSRSGNVEFHSSNFFYR